MRRALAVVLVSFAAPLTAQLDAAKQKRIDAICKRFDHPSRPGVSVAVTHKGELVFRKAYGCAHLEHGIPIKTDTIFHVASVTKQFTAFALVLLEQDGKLALDDDVRKHVPWLHDFGAKITIRHLLNHTSGLRDQWELLMISGYRLDDVLTEDHILRILKAQRELNFPPGSRYLYCNSGYTLAAHIVEKVSGQSFEAFCEERIFAPLGMTRSHMHMDHRQIVPGRAYCYGRRGLGWQKLVLSYANAGATSLFTTAPDLAKWLHNFASGKVGGEDGIKAMLKRGVLTPGGTMHYALGVVHGAHNGRPTIGHGGADAGFRSNVMWFPKEQLGVVVLANVADANPAGVARAVADVVLGAKAKPPQPRKGGARGGGKGLLKKPLPKMDLDAFVGRYYCPELEVYYRIERDGKSLCAMHRRHGKIALRVHGVDQLEGRRSFVRRLEFTRTDGKVDGFRMHGGRVLNLKFVRVR